MNRRRLIVLVVIALIAVGIVAGLPRIRSLMTPDNNQDADLEYLAIETGTLSSFVSATGSVEPRAETVLSFETSGRIIELLVQENDTVTKGMVLARLDTAQMAETVLQAQASLAGAQAQLAQVMAGSRPGEIAVSKAAVVAAEAGVAAAQAEVQRAEAQLEQVLAGPTDADIAIAQSAVDNAQAQLDQLLLGPNVNSVEIAKLNWDLALNTLWQAQLERDAVKGRGMAIPEYQKTLADANVSAAEVAARIAELQYFLAGEGTAEEVIRAAEAGVRQARAQLEKAKAGASEAEIDMVRAGVDAAKAQLAAAQAQVDQAEAQLSILESGASEEEIALAQAQVDQLQAAFRQANLALDGAVIKAPFDGTVAMVHADLNDLVSPSMPVISLIDGQEFHIDVSVDETDVGKIAVGQDVEITLDAFRDAAIEGEVNYVAPTATMDAGIVSYLVRIAIRPTDLPMRSGLTTNASIITEVREDVVLVPNLAISIDPESGQKYVTKKTLTGPVKVFIETGLTSDLYSEVTAGLQEGDTVAISTLSSREQFREMMGSTFMGGGQ